MGEPPFVTTTGIITKIELVFVSVGSKVGARLGVVGGSATIADTTLLLLVPMTLVTSIKNLYWKVYCNPVTSIMKVEAEREAPYWLKTPAAPLSTITV